jgi:transcription elongation factor S-II
MELQEVNAKSKALQKATTAGEPPANILKILNDLKTGVVATEDLLRSTKIGVIVNKSKQHKNTDVARLASEIVSKWRNDVTKKKPATPAKRANGTSSPAPNTASEKPKSTVPPDQRTWRKDGIDITKTGDKTRDNCIGLIYDGLCHMSEESEPPHPHPHPQSVSPPSPKQPKLTPLLPAPSTILKRASEVERAAFSEFGPETAEAYRTKMRSLYQNLKNKSNPSLRKRVLSGEVTPERFVVMTHEELKSAERRAEDAKIQKENMDMAMVAQAERSVSTSLQCGKCGQRKVSYSQAQTRSADEPMTTFCECTICGTRWKVGSNYRGLVIIEEWLVDFGLLVLLNVGVKDAHTWAFDFPMVPGLVALHEHAILPIYRLWFAYA